MRKRKFITLTLIMAILCIAIMFIMSRNNNTIAADYRIGDIVLINGDGINPVPDNGLYCIQYGPTFTPGYFICYDIASIPSDVVYVIGHTNPGNYSYYDGTFRTDIRQNYLWEALGNGSHAANYAGMANDIANLRAEANIISNLSSSSVTINDLEDEFIKQNAEGKYGPFVINYPSVNGKWVGDSLKVTLNGQELSTIPESGKEFYLTEADGIKFGEKNILQISYDATKYDGAMYKFSPEQDMVINAKCPDCDIELPAKGYLLENGEIVVQCSNCENLYIVEGAFLQGNEKQRAALVTVDSYPIHLKDSVEFWVGRKIVIDLNKTDNGKPAQALENVEFIVDILNSSTDKTYILKDDYSKLIQTSIVTDKDGKAQIVIITYEDIVRVQIEEKYSQYYIDNGPIVINFVYDDTTSTWTPNIIKPTGAIDNLVDIKENRQEEFTFDLNIINKLKIEDLKIIKINASVPGEYIEGITFRITLDNAVTEDGQPQVILTTDANGELNLGTLEILDPSKNVTATIEEIGVPTSDVNFKGLYPGGEVIVTIWHADRCNVSVTGAPSDIAKAEYDIETNIITVEIKNEITLDLAGRVWQDDQTGLKPVKAPNNIQDAGEEGIANIKVVAKRVSDNFEVAEVRTDSNGDYSFKNLPASVDGSMEYYIEFTYDGINYIAVTPNVGSDDSIDSDAAEIDRTAFNNKFATIVKDNAIGTDGTRTPLEYTYDATTATLQTMNGTEVKPEFAMIAETRPTTYNKNTTDIDLGLVKKEVDLAAVTDIYSAKVTINGEEAPYTYNKSISLDDNIAINTDPKPNYSLYLYNSDYNYRIWDYTGLGKSRINSSMNPTQDSMDKTVADEINVELTYKVLLNNQSATDARINEIALYYDTAYTLVNASNLATATYYDGGTENINGVEYKKVIVKDVNAVFNDTDNQEEIILTFALNKDKDRNLLYGDNKKVWVEITSYSTDTGCIDKDSAPNNILEHRTEDDTDDARGLNITKNSFDRTISGYVFEDTKSNTPGAYNTGNGTYEAGEAKIDDVIVQLIEVKKVGNSKLEYIWQETVSGSNTVKYITTDGKNIATYNVSNGKGQYTFKDFIPGEYIIRFIYGDGTYYDNPIDNTRSQADILANITKYNGQDYKSTVDKYYNIIDIDIRRYPENNSMARDNEARRLEEMAYATSPDTNAADLIIDGKDKLKNTWMCAETSTIEIPVSDETFRSDSQSDSESYDVSDLSGGSKSQVARSVNFGLVKRPQAELELEKHIKHLYISGASDVDASASLSNYSTNGRVNITGKGVNIAEATNKEENIRGQWVVDGPTAADLQGQKISITYGYKVRNVGDTDYIGRELRTRLDNKESGKTVSDIYKELADDVKYLMYNSNDYSNSIGKYLGTAYYNGNTNGQYNASVGTNVKVEDYTGKNLNFEAGRDFTEKDNIAVDEKNKNIWTVTGDGYAKKDKEEVSNIITSRVLKITSEAELEATVGSTIQATGGKSEFTYRSYAAQLIAGDMQTSETGTLMKNSILGNLPAVQSYVEPTVVPLTDKEFMPEKDESIAETVILTVDTGGDKQSTVMLITAITGGLAVIAVGVVLIKKFIIK